MKRKFPVLAVLATATGIALVYYATLTRNYYWDGIGFAQAIDDVPRLAYLIHPNHLIYTLFGYAAHQLISPLLPEVRSLTTLQVFNTIFGAAAVIAFYFLARRLFRSPYISVSLTVLFASSSTWWRFATDADAYIPSVCFLLLAALAASTHPPRTVLATAAFTAAMVFHELAVLMAPALVAFIRYGSPGHWKRQAVSVVGIAGLLTATAYLLGYAWQTGSWDIGGFAAWITSHAQDASFSFNVWHNAIESVKGNIRLLIGGKFPRWNQLTAATIALMTLSAAFWGLFVARVVTARKHAGRSGTIDRSILWPVLCWIVPYVLFLFVWLPQNVFYRLFYLPGALLLAGVVASAASESAGRRGRLALFAVAIAVSNLTFSILPNTRTESNVQLQFARDTAALWPMSVVYFKTHTVDDWTVRYFNPRSVWINITTRDLSALDAELQDIRRQGRLAWLDATALQYLEQASPDDEAWVRKHTIPELRLIDPNGKLRFERLRAPEENFAP